jgi:hypothetical protein
MAVSLERLLNLANNNLQDSTNNLATADRQELVKKAVIAYSKRQPYVTIQAYTGNATGFYAKPTGWDDDFSSFREIEYPVEQSPKQLIRRSDYDLELTPTGDQLRFFQNKPGDNKTFWVRYTAAHPIDSDSNYSTVAAKDAEGISYLATALMCGALASFYATKANSNLANVDIVGYATRTQEYKGLATHWAKLYDKAIRETITGKHDYIPFISNSYWDRTNS